MLHGQSNNQLETFNVTLLDTEPGFRGLGGPPINLQGSGWLANEWWWKKHTQLQQFTRRIFCFSFRRCPIKAPLTGRPNVTSTRNPTNLQSVILFFGKLVQKNQNWWPNRRCAAPRAFRMAWYSTTNLRLVLKLTGGPAEAPYRAFVSSVASPHKVRPFAVSWLSYGGTRRGAYRA